MVTFGEIAHMVDATQLCCLRPWTHLDATPMHHEVGMVTFGEHAHMVNVHKVFWKNSKSCCDKKKTSRCAVTSSRCENMSGSSSVRFRENQKSTSFA